MVTAQEVIQKLNLQPLPGEGGYFRETYKSSSTIPPASHFGILSLSEAKERPSGTAIFYLVTPESFSLLHRLSNDEIFHFYSGDSVEMIQIDEKGHLKKIVLGSDFMKGETPQVLVPKGTWQALSLKKGGHWALLGTTMAPGFDLDDFELGHRDELLKEFPNYREEILVYTKE